MRILSKVLEWIRTKRTRKIPYYKGIGYMYRVSARLTPEILKEWLDEQVKKGEHFSVQMIVGELD